MVQVDVKEDEEAEEGGDAEDSAAAKAASDLFAAVGRAVVKMLHERGFIEDDAEERRLTTAGDATDLLRVIAASIPVRPDFDDAMSDGGEDSQMHDLNELGYGV